MSCASPRQDGGFSIEKANRAGAPAFSIGLRNKWKNEDYRRGPGCYNPCANSPSTPAFSMGARLKPKASDSWQRGPGSYEVGDLKRGPSFSLGIRELHKQRNPSTGPGPGSYNIEQSSFTRASAPSYSMAGRCAAAPLSHSPGPGAYNISAAQSKAGPSAHSAASRTTTTTDSAALGRSTMRSAPAFSFGMRSSAHVDRTPGPGAYNSDVRSAGPAFSIASRGTKAKGGKDLNPGPGAYEVASTVVRRSGPSFTIAHKA